ncbi:hypothetical protein DPEC_G00362870 [Dallia pectoralis]|nr:hypothetical protein DPEC_G00362870 [Dallia pectoralis]
MVLLIDQLLQELMGEKGRDLMGIPLLNRAKMEHIWTTQKKHVKCIQDVPGVLLYTETGSCTKEGFQLTTYRLAECLVELRHQTSMTIHSQQPINIVGLWQDLLDYDKQRVVFAARHQEKLTNGRFRHKNKVEFTPDVVSLKWRVLASTGSPAQWIDCCRLVEAMFIRLWNIHKNPKKQGNTTMSRWTLNLQDYRKIRQLVVGNEQGWTGYREYRAFSGGPMVIFCLFSPPLQVAELNLSDRIVALEETVARLSSENQQLKDKTDDLESRSRRCNLRIVGIPEKMERGDPVGFMTGFFTEEHTGTSWMHFTCFFWVVQMCSILARFSSESPMRSLPSLPHQSLQQLINEEDHRGVFSVSSACRTWTAQP